MLSKTAIFGAPDLKTEDATVPEWPDESGSPGIVRFKQMTAEQQSALNKKIENNPDDGMYLMIIASAIDADGKPLFTEEDIPALKQKSMRVLNRLQNICLRLNSLRDTEVALKKD